MICLSIADAHALPLNVYSNLTNKVQTEIANHGNSSQHCSKRRSFSQIFDQILHVIQIPAQQALFLRRCLCAASLSTSRRAMNVSAQPLAGASLHPLGRARGVFVGTIPVTRKRSFWHEVEVQKLDELHLDFSAGGTGFE